MGSASAALALHAAINEEWNESDAHLESGMVFIGSPGFPEIGERDFRSCISQTHLRLWSFLSVMGNSLRSSEEDSGPVLARMAELFEFIISLILRHIELFSAGASAQNNLMTRQMGLIELKLDRLQLAMEMLEFRLANPRSEEEHDAEAEILPANSDTEQMEIGSLNGDSIRGRSGKSSVQVAVEEVNTAEGAEAAAEAEGNQVLVDM